MEHEFFDVENFNEKPFFYWEYVIIWLENFSRKYPYFSDDKWLDLHNELCNWDKKYIVNLYLLFDKIKDYANKNYLLPCECDDEERYCIEWHDAYYYVGQKKEGYYCRKLNNCINDSISFDAILSDKKTDRAMLIDCKLDILSQLVKSYVLDGIPYDAILDVIHQSSNRCYKDDIFCKVKKRYWEWIFICLFVVFVLWFFVVFVYVIL